MQGFGHESSSLGMDVERSGTSQQDTKTGGAERDRTADLLIANETLFQLSYGPNLTMHTAEITVRSLAIQNSPDGDAPHANRAPDRVRPGFRLYEPGFADMLWQANTQAGLSS